MTSQRGHGVIPHGKLERVYMAFTPYHLLLCLAIQDRDGYPNAKILFADEAGVLEHAAELGNVVRGLVDVQRAPTLERHPAWQYPIRCRILARSARQFLHATGAGEVYIANGVRPESQMLFRAHRSGLRFRFVEDGLDTYIGSNRSNVAPSRRLLHRTLCGSAHPSTGDMVEACSYASYDVIAPDLSRTPHELSRRIPTESIRRIADTLWPGLALAPPSNPITDIYLLANSERMPSVGRYMESIRARLKIANEDHSHTCVAVKAHPRERNRQLLTELEDLGAYVVPHWVPAELLVGILDPRVSVHCGLTTFVLSSRLLLPGRQLRLDESVSLAHTRILEQWEDADRVS